MLHTKFRDHRISCSKVYPEGKPRVINYKNVVELESSMLHTKFRDHRISCFEEDDF